VINSLDRLRQAFEVAQAALTTPKRLSLPLTS
jgi:hypothetical protein